MRSIAQERCKACTRIVYIKERLVLNQDVYHVPCFRCAACDKTLSLTNYHTGRIGSVLCLKHFSEEKSGSVAVLSKLPSALAEKSVAKSAPTLAACRTQRLVDPANSPSAFRSRTKGVVNTDNIITKIGTESGVQNISTTAAAFQFFRQRSSEDVVGTSSTKTGLQQRKRSKTFSDMIWGKSKTDCTESTSSESRPSETVRRISHTSANDSHTDEWAKQETKNGKSDTAVATFTTSESAAPVAKPRPRKPTPQTEELTELLESTKEVVADHSVCIPANDAIDAQCVQSPEFAVYGDMNTLHCSVYEEYDDEDLVSDVVNVPSEVHTTDNNETAVTLSQPETPLVAEVTAEVPQTDAATRTQVVEEVAPISTEDNTTTDIVTTAQRPSRLKNVERTIRSLSAATSETLATMRSSMLSMSRGSSSDFSEPLIKEAPGWIIEGSADGLTDVLESRVTETAERSSMEFITDPYYYRDVFSGQRHQNYVYVPPNMMTSDSGEWNSSTDSLSLLTNGRSASLLFLSVMRDTNEGCHRAVLRSRDRITRCRWPLDTAPTTPESIARAMDANVTEFMAGDMLLVSDDNLVTELCRFDDQMAESKNFKFGVLFVTEGQSTEEEMFGNPTHSVGFESFLSCLGQRIPLKGYSGYKGGLDITQDLTGKESYVAQIDDNAIMFHVSTLLPHNAHERQQLQRKRHIGNDIVTVVYMEGRYTPFAPDCISSQFVHTYIVVQPVYSGREREIPAYFKVAVTNKKGVSSSYLPHIAPGSMFPNGPQLRSVLLAKMVAAERAALSSPAFTKLSSRTREHLLRSLLPHCGNLSEFRKRDSKSSPLTARSAFQRALASFASPRSSRASISSMGSFGSGTESPVLKRPGAQSDATTADNEDNSTPSSRRNSRVSALAALFSKGHRKRSSVSCSSEGGDSAQGSPSSSPLSRLKGRSKMSSLASADL